MADPPQDTSFRGGGYAAAAVPVASAPQAPKEKEAADNGNEFGDECLEGPEQDTELFHLYRQKTTAKPGIRVNDVTWAREFANASGDYVPTLSMLGDTRSGKSFLVNRLKLPGERGPREANEEGSLCSTTCDAHLYFTEALKPDTNMKLQILDFEGENGGGVQQQLNHGFGQMAAFFNRPTDANDRRVLVNRYFPRVAFLLGDIVCLVGTEDLTNHRYFKRCQEFAVVALQLVRDVANPYLLLLQNKVSPREFRASRNRDLTADFLEAHKESGAEELFTQFAGVRCCKIPMLEELQMENPRYELDPDNEPEYIWVKTEKIFEEAMKQVTQVITTWMLQINKVPTGMSQAMWFHLSRFIVDAVSKEQPISIASVSASMSSIENKKVDQVVKYFGVLFQHVSQQGADRPAQYLFSRRQALDLACRIFVSQVLGHGGTRVFNSQWSVLQGQFREYYDKLADELDKFEPCIETHPTWVSDTPKQDQVVHCYQSRDTHTCHRAWESVEPRTIFQHIEAFLMQVVRTYSTEFVQKTFNPSWSGEFKGLVVDRTAELQRLDDDIRKMLEGNHEGMMKNTLEMMKDIVATLGHNSVRELCMPHAVLGSCMMCATEYPGEALRAVPTPLRRKLFAVCADCMQTLSEMEPGDEAGMWEDKCCVCFDSQANVLFLPCGHINMCFECVETLPELNGRRRLCPQDRRPIRGYERIS